MARPKPTLSVIRSPIAIDEIQGIWLWNAEHYSPAHADAYVRYLEQSIDHLDRRYATGKTVSVRPDLQYVVIRRKSKGHGHVAVYRVRDRVVELLHVFHTAEDWEAKLGK